MDAHEEKLVKEAYAYGAAQALTEAGFSEKVAAEEVAHLFNTPELPSDERVKQAYTYGVAAALREGGLDEKTAEATAVEWTTPQQ